MGICRNQHNRLAAAAVKAAVRLVRACILPLCVGLLAACSAQSLLSWEASDKTRPHYKVERGDTLYSIAWAYGTDFRRLAVANDLHPPYPIKPGQLLRLPAGSSTVVARKPSPSNAKPSSHRKPPTTTTRRATPAAKPAAAPVAKPAVAARPKKPAPRVDVGKVNLPHKGRWGWPSSGRILKNWGARKHQRSGLDIAATPGSPVSASAAGVVVYSGSGLARYGQLIIVKHSEELLSAYAYNQKILVKKGQHVRAGERIAQSGRSPDGVGALHFEVRKSGKPVDALGYLKRRGNS